MPQHPWVTLHDLALLHYVSMNEYVMVNEPTGQSAGIGLWEVVLLYPSAKRAARWVLSES